MLNYHFWIMAPRQEPDMKNTTIAVLCFLTAVLGSFALALFEAWIEGRGGL